MHCCNSYSTEGHAQDKETTSCCSMVHQWVARPLSLMCCLAQARLQRLEAGQYTDASASRSSKKTCSLVHDSMEPSVCAMSASGSRLKCSPEQARLLVASPCCIPALHADAPLQIHLLGCLGAVLVDTAIHLAVGSGAGCVTWQ